MKIGMRYWMKLGSEIDFIFCSKRPDEALGAPRASVILKSLMRFGNFTSYEDEVFNSYELK